MPVPSSLILLSISSALVGLVHSLAPGHWLPVVLMSKSRRWSTKNAVLGASIAASGHIFTSGLIAILSILVGSQLFTHYGEKIERYGAVLLLIFGLVYAGVAYFRHSECHGHSHHGPDPRGKKGPYLFLFSLGLSPCVAALPFFVAASARGTLAVLVTLIAFAAGVLVALNGATILVNRGFVKLDHPVFEHQGDLITGLGVAAMGLILFWIPL